MQHTFAAPNMALVDSLLTAIVRADGDALVMHVGEKPYEEVTIFFLDRPDAVPQPNCDEL